MTDREPPAAAGSLPEEWAGQLGYEYLASQVAGIAKDARALKREVRVAVLTEAARRLSLTEGLARAVLQLADDLNMPDDAWTADIRVQAARAALGIPGDGRDTHSRLWGEPGEEAGDAAKP